jgi:hypothetical protein
MVSRGWRTAELRGGNAGHANATKSRRRQHDHRNHFQRREYKITRSQTHVYDKSISSVRPGQRNFHSVERGDDFAGAAAQQPALHAAPALHPGALSGAQVDGDVPLLPEEEGGQVV